MCVCACVRACAPACERAHMVELDETTKEIKQLEAISTFSPVGSRSSDGIKMRACERARARARARVCTKLISVHYCNTGMSTHQFIPYYASARARAHTHTHAHTHAARTDAHILMLSSEDREPNMHVSMRING